MEMYLKECTMFNEAVENNYIVQLIRITKGASSSLFYFNLGLGDFGGIGNLTGGAGLRTGVELTRFFPQPHPSNKLGIINSFFDSSNLFLLSV